LTEIALFLYEGMTALDAVGPYGAEPVAERVVVEGKVITAAGVSAGIDMALTLAGRLAGEDEAQALQLVIEYDPRPPYDSGSLEKAAPQTHQRATEILTRGVEQPIASSARAAPTDSPAERAR
jgi:transcriptional regulator GlxA family with amidase domain